MSSPRRDVGIITTLWPHGWARDLRTAAVWESLVNKYGLRHALAMAEGRVQSETADLTRWRQLGRRAA